jgi:transposase
MTLTTIDIPIAVIDRLDTATFEELAGFVHESVASAEQHARKSIHHLIEAGGALCAMRDRMPGQFNTWMSDEGIDRVWASRCQRLFTYRDQIPQSVFEEYVDRAGRQRRPSLTSAIASLAHLPKLTDNNKNHNRTFTDLQQAVVKRMISDGVPATEIAAVVDVSPHVVYALKNPNRVKEQTRRSNERRKARKDAERALQKQQEREERDRLAKANGKELSAAYAAVRQALAALDKATIGNAVLARRATDYLTAAESCIVAAMRAERAA